MDEHLGLDLDEDEENGLDVDDDHEGEVVGIVLDLDVEKGHLKAYPLYDLLYLSHDTCP